MGVLRCTAKYRRLRDLPGELKEPPNSTGALGDWYANALHVGHARYLHFMSEVSRLSVLITLRESRSAEMRFKRTLLELLQDIGVAESHAEREVAALEPLHFAPTRSRSVLGSMNDQAFAAKIYLEHESPWDAMVRLSDTPCSPLGYETPRDVTTRVVAELWSGPKLVE